MVQNEIIELAEHVEKLLSELTNDNDYSASKQDMFFTSNEELQKKIGQTPFNARLKEELAKQTYVDYTGAPPGVGFQAHNYANQLGSYSGVTSGEGLPTSIS